MSDKSTHLLVKSDLVRDQVLRRVPRRYLQEGGGGERHFQLYVLGEVQPLGIHAAAFSPGPTHSPRVYPLPPLPDCDPRLRPLVPACSAVRTGCQQQAWERAPPAHLVVEVHRLALKHRRNRSAWV